MELRNFKKWLIDNELDTNELYAEAIKCYQVEAYKAAYLYTYLGNMRYINELIISYKGIPKSFKKKTKDDETKTKEWLKVNGTLKNEDSREAGTYELIVGNEENGNIFELKPQIRDLFPDMKRLRNTSAHAKERRISDSTVQELWNNIIYVKPYFMINGTLEAWKSEFDKLIIYSNGNEEDDKNLIKLVNEFSIFSDESKQEIINQILMEYLVSDEIDYNENDVIKLFYIKCLDKNELNSIENDDKLYISILTGNCKLIYEPLIMVKLLEERADEYWFRELCVKNADNFFQVIDILSARVQQDKLAEIIFHYIDKNGKILENTNYRAHSSLKNNSCLLKKIMGKISHLYYYRMNSTGQKRYKTSKFDYVRFNQYKYFIRYVFYCISAKPDLRKQDEIGNFILRCEETLEEEYSSEGFQSELAVQDYIKEFNDEFSIIIRSNTADT